ncbi:MAG TPA: hypothetical protein VKZ18_15190 [Polyangia bacterium]|nr:hypothetical protein [Polyangia bacterium]
MPFVFLIVTCFAGGLLATGCASTPNNGGSLAANGGSVQIALQVGGATVNSVSYTITGPASFTQSGTIDVSHSNGISAQLGPFAAGGPYTITLTGASTDGSESCAGSASFSVTAGQTAQVTVPLTCHQAPRTGSVSVNGAVNVCPQIDALDANPTEVFVGGSVGLAGTAHDADNGPSALTATWTATSGVFTESAGLSTRFTCTAPGPATITLTVSDGDATAGCPATSSLTVTCDARPAAATCQLGNGAGAIKHVIYLQFDNTHLIRDKANVASDLEQMPHLLNFIRGNGTMMANDHTQLISHTSVGMLTSLTGVYPDRTGQTVGNSYSRISATGTFSFPSGFEYWTDTAAAGVFNMVTPTGQNAPAPWVAYTRAGCDVGNVSTANAVLETASASTFSDVATVFGTSSPQFAEAKASAAAASGTAAANLAQTDFVGLAVHCAQGSTRCATGNGGVADKLPGEPGGYTGFNGLFGAQSINPLLTGTPGVDTALTSMLGNPIVDPFGQPGFPGFDGMEAEVTLRYIATMQEQGIPVTYGYISDAHDFHGVAGNQHLAMGPGSQQYEQQLAAYDQAFANFFTELAAHGIDKTNTLFVITVDEGDHFVGGTPTPATCDGTPGNYCDYTTNNQIGEIQVNIDTAVQTEFPSLFNTFLASTGPDTFTVHGDDAPTFYLARKGAGPLGQTDPDTRTFERTIAGLTEVNPYTGSTDNLLAFYADQTGMKAVHMFTTGDPARNAQFVFFGDPDYFITDFPTSTCADCIGNAFAWNHGDIQKEIGQTWAGYVGPGVANLPDQTIFTDHTDLRPTINALLGLQDTYESDGRVVTEALVASALPGAVAGSQATLQALGAAYKAINAPFGQFAQDIVVTSTKALQGADPGDTIYTSKETSIANLTTARDVLAAEIRAALDQAEFAAQPIDPTLAASFVSQAQSLLTSADALAAAP